MKETILRMKETILRMKTIFRTKKTFFMSGVLAAVFIWGTDTVCAGDEPFFGRIDGKLYIGGELAEGGYTVIDDPDNLNSWKWAYWLKGIIGQSNLEYRIISYEYYKNGEPATGWYGPEGEVRYFTCGTAMEWTPKGGLAGGAELAMEYGKAMWHLGLPFTGWQAIDLNYIYWQDGNLYSGTLFASDNEEWYDLRDKPDIWLETGREYILTEGCLAEGWQEIDGDLYWYENGSRQGYNPEDASFRGKEIYDPAANAWFWLDNNKQGARAVNKDVYQESYAGAYADQEDGTGKWVRYDNDGKMVKGWSVSENGTYYFDLSTGAMAKGDTVIEGESYHFDIDTGILSDVKKFDSMWINIDGKEYWYEDGIRQGYRPEDAFYRGKEIYDPATDAWYFLDNVQKGAKTVNKDVYQDSWAGDFAEKEDGTGKWVHYDENGYMSKGWEYVWVHYGDDGSADEIFRNNDKNIGLEKWGSLTMKSYYFDPKTGAMAKGCVVIDGQERYFDEITGLSR